MTPTTAQTDAKQAATASITNQQIHCHDIEVDVESTDFDKQPGQPGQVTVRLSCRLDLSDLAVPGVPGTRVLSATMSSPIDTWRER